MNVKCGGIYWRKRLGVSKNKKCSAQIAIAAAILTVNMKCQDSRVGWSKSRPFMGNTMHIDYNVKLRMHLKCGVHKVFVRDCNSYDMNENWMCWMLRSDWNKLIVTNEIVELRNVIAEYSFNHCFVTDVKPAYFRQDICLSDLSIIN